MKSTGQSKALISKDGARRIVRSRRCNKSSIIWKAYNKRYKETDEREPELAAAVFAVDMSKSVCQRFGSFIPSNRAKRLKYTLYGHAT